MKKLGKQIAIAIGSHGLDVIWVLGLKDRMNLVTTSSLTQFVVTAFMRFDNDAVG